MVLAIDVDGVLADFNSTYVPHVIQYTGKDLFPPDYDMRQPPCWDYPPVFGYTNEEYKTSFSAIKEVEEFWRWLQPEPGAEEALKRLDYLSAEHDVFFVTNRAGKRVKQQTEEWLRDYGMQYPTVIVAADKTPFLRALKIDVFVDDRVITANDTLRIAQEEQWPTFRMYLPDRTYNRENRADGLIVVADLNEALNREGF